MLIENEEFTGGGPETWGEAAFRYCTFTGVDHDGINFDGILQGCTLTRCRFYWGFFNTALFDTVRFVDCDFPGASFRSVHMIDCTFDRCRFGLSNLGGGCTIDQCLIAATTFDGCTWTTAPGKARDITASRFLGCTFPHSRGFEGLDTGPEPTRRR